MTRSRTPAFHRHACHRCRSTAVLRDIRRHGLERLVLALLGWRRYWCLDCGARFYERPLPAVRPLYALRGAPRPWREETR